MKLEPSINPKLFLNFSNSDPQYSYNYILTNYITKLALHKTNGDLKCSSQWIFRNQVQREHIDFESAEGKPKLN